MSLNFIVSVAKKTLNLTVKSGNFANWKRSIVYSSNYPLNKLIGVYKNHQYHSATILPCAAM
ncbi:hypothetical protein Patl1_10599 [Pistacia atlantica]|uniref:Uncharacterized protein n=1 Tax=Pistacia atlantica TaxID=434234 RepID=A0ACC1A4U1_9ROSI|nr:hypothetical protein Patl1_10599 [Pistacia atlantica]